MAVSGGREGDLSDCEKRGTLRGGGKKGSTDGEGTTDGDSTLKTTALTEVNRNILEIARGSKSGETAWEFFCECGRPDCHAHVELTLEAYAALHDAGAPVLADGHEPSQVERARRLGADAEALRRRAGHQTARAKRNLRT